MSVRSETVAALVEVLDPNERAALLWAAQLGAGIADTNLPGVDSRTTLAVGRTLRTLLPALRDAAVAPAAPARPDHLPTRADLLKGVSSTIGIGTGDTGQYLGVVRSPESPFDVVSYCVIDERAYTRIDLALPGALVRNLHDEMARNDRSRIGALAEERKTFPDAPPLRSIPLEPTDG
jgi:hypothetical protein